MKVFFRFNGPEQEIEFVRWTAHFLVLRYPKWSVSDDKLWRVRRETAEKWRRQGVLRFEEGQ